MRAILRAILSVALLLGSGLTDWTPTPAQSCPCAQESCCCCGTPADAGSSCPCPKPAGNRGPAPSLGQDRAAAVALVASRCTQGERRTEPRPEPDAWAASAETLAEGRQPTVSGRGRDPDLGRHLARLGISRI